MAETDQIEPSIFTFTCLACSVAFRTTELQREHYKTDWHRYNLKRKLAEMPPLSADSFNERVLVQQTKLKTENTALGFSAHCVACNKHYSSKNAYQNHLLSNKHKENESRDAIIRTSTNDEEYKERKTIVISEKNSILSENQTIIPEDEIIRAIDEKIANATPLKLEDCLFCSHHCESLDSIMQHMTHSHSFFIPDIEYLNDLQGLIQYLGEKIAIGNVCLYCNGKGRGFYSIEAVQKHMRDKGHCKLLYEGDAELEIAQFYDFRSSYPDYQGDNDEETKMNEWMDEEILETGPDSDIVMDRNQGSKETSFIADDSFELVLSTGSRVGHRSFHRYYRQRFRPEDSRDSVVINRLMNQYRAIGWNTSDYPQAGLREHQRLHREQSFKTLVGIKANRFQPHFREQIL